MKLFCVLILLSIGTTQVSTSNGGTQTTCCQSCCGPTCQKVQPVNISFPTIVNNQSTFDVVIVPSSPMYAGVDNICWSFLNLTQDTYTLFASEIYCNGYNYTYVYQVTETSPGVLKFGSTLCNFQGTIFGQIIIKEEGCNVILIYLCFLFGDCDLEPSNKTPVVIGLSPTGSKLSPLCVYKATDLIDRAGFGSQDYIILPRTQPSMCVTNYPH